MDLLFIRRYQYVVNKPLKNVVQYFNKITLKKDINFSENIIGNIKDDNSFRCTHQWTLGTISGVFGKDFATITGTIYGNDEETIISMTLKPNLGLVLLFYFFVVSFLLEIFGIKSIFDGDGAFLSLMLFFFGVVILGIIFFMTNGLKKTFEKVLCLQKKLN